ncbi:MAG TPA: efflux RND transporter periplasmic adaptor subunit [Solirubrobacteraceae bacterium]|nr:efflux RND transporter periplasmic adaptor subunit [Solirubrobacteraceae bacterium]
MSERSGRPWLNYALGLACLGAIVAAVLVIGPAPSSSATTRRTAKAALGVVQSTVSGSGNLEPASQLNLGFKTAGTVERIYVKQGQYVTGGKLLATLDSVPLQVTLEQARATLQSSEAALAKEEETGGEGTSGASTGPSVGSASVSPHDRGSAGASAAGKAEEAASTQSTTTGSTSTLSPATREANIASARAAVKSDQLTVQGDEEALAAAKLYAPEDGTIVSLSGQVGEVVSATGTTRASSSSSSASSGSGSSAGSGSGRSSSGASGSSSSSGASGSSGSGSSSAFAMLSDLSSMKVVAALSESEIGQVKVGQIATVTVEALEGRKLAAHVSEVATLSTSSSGVVSYDVTFTLDQMDAGLKPGMSATAEVIVKQEEGVSVPSSAISGGSVTVLRGGKNVRQAVTTGLAGNSSTIVLTGVKAGETVVLPQASSTSSTNLSSLLRSRLGGGGGGGGAFLGGGGGGAAIFRGGG